MPVAQLSVLKYQLKPQIGLNATKNAVIGSPSRNSRTSPDGSETRLSLKRRLKLKRLSSHRFNSHSAGLFMEAAFALNRRAQARRSIGLVARRHTSRNGNISAIANTSVINRSPAVATNGEMVPSRSSDNGIRPAWMARNTTAIVDIQNRSVVRTNCDPVSALDLSRPNISFLGMRSAGSGCLSNTNAAPSDAATLAGASTIRQPAATI